MISQILNESTIFHLSTFFPLFIYMGRKKKYITKQQLEEANKEKYMRYYWKNLKRRRKDALKRYYKKKEEKNETLFNDKNT